MAILLIGSLYLFFPKAKADTLQNTTQTVLEDVVCTSTDPNGNYGSYEYNIGANTTASTRISFIKFDISNISVTPNSITDASFKMYQPSSLAGGNGNVSVHGVINQTWKEETVTFNDHPVAFDMIDTELGPSTGWWVWNVTSWVINQTATGHDNCSFYIKSLDIHATSLKGGRWHSKEEGSNPPILNVSYTDFSPICSYIYLNSTLNGTDVNFKFTLSDDVKLSQYVFGWNNSGNWINQSGSLGTKFKILSLVKTINETAGITINFELWVNDSIDQWITIGLHGFQTNTEPTIIIPPPPISIQVLFIGACVFFGPIAFLFWFLRRKR